MSDKADAKRSTAPGSDLLAGFDDATQTGKPRRAGRARKTDAGPARSPADPAVASKAGHRQRLRERFAKGGRDAVHDYELLELVLFRAMPRRDIKDLAKTLIGRFGTFAEVVHAPEHLLREIKPMSEAAIFELKLVRAAALELKRDDVMDKPILSSWQQVLDYCRTLMGYETREQFRILFLDKKNNLIADELQGQGTVDHTPVYIREVVKRALELSSTALVLVHNHPSGDTKPSRADIDMTRAIEAAAKPLGIILHDHIIVGRGAHFSFRTEKLI